MHTPVTPEELERVYRAEIAAEKKRDYMYYKYGAGRHLVPLERIIPHDDEAEEPRCLADGGDAAWKMYGALDGEHDPGHRRFGLTPKEYQRRKDSFVRKLRRTIPEAVPVFLLVCKNGPNRQESIRCLMKLLARKTGRYMRLRKGNITDTSKKF